jgi:signal peptidase II
MIARKAGVFWPLLGLLILTDCTTKRLAEEHLRPEHVPHEVLGEVVRLTLAYNRDAAMGINAGQWSRPVFTLLAIAILAMLGSMYRNATASDRWLAFGLALIAGGAIGNLLDRVRSERGVVDFIDIGVGAYRFWIFNVADMGVTIGAAMLGFLLWQRDRSSGDRSASRA